MFILIVILRATLGTWINASWRRWDFLHNVVRFASVCYVFTHRLLVFSCPQYRLSTVSLVFLLAFFHLLCVDYSLWHFSFCCFLYIYCWSYLAILNWIFILLLLFIVSPMNFILHKCSLIFLFTSSILKKFFYLYLVHMHCAYTSFFLVLNV